jgi:hypothetical protein
MLSLVQLEVPFDVVSIGNWTKNKKKSVTIKTIGIILFSDVQIRLTWGNKRMNKASSEGKCWNLLSAARKPTRVNGGDNRVTCSGAIALLI